MKFLRRLLCRHKSKTLVVLHTITTAELVADKCARCGKLKNKRIET